MKIMRPKTEKNKDFSDKFRQQLKNLRNREIDNCPQAESLSRYFNNDLSNKENKLFEDHLNFCPICSYALEKLKITGEIEKNGHPKIWNDVEKQLDEKFYSSLDSISFTPSETAVAPQWHKYFEILQENWNKFLEIFSRPKVLAYAGSFVMLLIISLYSVTYFGRSDIFYLAEIEIEQSFSLRDRTVSSAFADGLKFFKDGKYKNAIEKFTFSLQDHPTHYSANLYNGLCYLSISKRGLPGLAYKYDTSKVKQALKFLETALLLANENQFYQEDCYWYLGKAYLMIKDIDNAKTQFDKILHIDKMNLMRKQDAREILSMLK
jgi:tetratricopeptide (TPR) repeat protein